MRVRNQGQLRENVKIVSMDTGMKAALKLHSREEHVRSTRSRIVTQVEKDRNCRYVVNFEKSLLIDVTWLHGDNDVFSPLATLAAETTFVSGILTTSGRAPPIGRQRLSKQLREAKK